MVDIAEVRRALEELRPGRENTELELRSGVSLKGRYLGFDGRCARILTETGEEAAELEDVVGIIVLIESEGPE